jgi:hypothetical protein
MKKYIPNKWYRDERFNNFYTYNTESGYEDLATFFKEISETTKLSHDISNVCLKDASIVQLNPVE